MKNLPKFFDYQWNPVLFLIWSYSFSAKRIIKAYLP